MWRHTRISLHSEFVLQFSVFAKYRSTNYQVQTVFKNVFEDSSPIEMLHISTILHHGGPCETAKRSIWLTESEAKIKIFLKSCTMTCCISSKSIWCMLNLSKVFNVLYAFFEICYPLDQDRKLGVEWDLSVDIGLSMHKATVRILKSAMLKVSLFNLLLLKVNGLCFLLCQELFLLTVLQIELELSNDTVLTLAIGGTIQEQCSGQDCLLISFLVSTSLRLVLMNGSQQILDRQMGVTYDVLTVFLIQCDRYVEELLSTKMLLVLDSVTTIWRELCSLCRSSLLAHLKHFVNILWFWNDVGVNGVHRDMVVIEALLLQYLLVELQVVRLKDFVLIQWEWILDCDVLNVLIVKEVTLLAHVFVQILGGHSVVVLVF